MNEVARFLSYVQPPGPLPLLALMLFAAHGLYIFIYFFRCLVTGPRLKGREDYEMFVAYWAVFFVNIVLVGVLPWLAVWAAIRSLAGVETVVERGIGIWKSLKA
ncbi:hypothetical protein CspeluHIS016_0211900 [Cutaneotrichosporon spelunceum]|uniref:Uncharacterized protein n=1 Tax=Cutaneotrichosporon spelunceum TaxID=1672016 RepID=A0AAD3TT17_9TREE|nr:hypothetical protein CspeluHIS016_0211900 [Cutaneotrichosporon spelunceum]